MGGLARRLALPLVALTALALAAAAPPSAARPGARPVADTTTTVTFAFVGDTILGNTPSVPADPAGYLSPVARALTDHADVVFGDLEGALTTSGTGKCGSSSGGNCYQFRNPPSFARAFASTGFDVLSLANNHAHDFGSAGQRSTESALHAAGVRWSGLPGQITYLSRHGVRIAIVAFAPYYYANNLLDLTAAKKLVRRAHANASIVVVYMHAGAEGAAADHVTGREEHYLHEDRGNPRKFAHLAIDNGASIVVASGPHVMRGMEFYRGRLAAYSLGDFANYRNYSTSGSLARSGILRVTVTTRGAFRAARLVSVHLAAGGRASVGGDSVAFVSSLSRQDFGAAAPRFSRDGHITRRQ
jgi:poly-gamma-glutamate capsule biosynthesis protein CapA/YwtB (metallophosphatase superfamily)